MYGIIILYFNVKSKSVEDFFLIYLAKTIKLQILPKGAGSAMSETGKDRLTVGFMIHHLDNDYSKALLKGAAVAANELDADLAIFPGRSLNSQLDDSLHTEYEYQYNVIYSYASEKSLDALVISAGTLGSFVTKEEFKTFIDRFEGVPVVTTENKVGKYPCVRMSGSGIKELVKHLIKKHGRKHIAFVSGPKGNADADERLSYYIEALEENGIEYDPDMVAYGKFSEYCVDIVGDLIDRNEGKLDAICFANDMMCKGGYKAIEQRGLIVGEDIAVTGYDDSEVAVSLKPPLTTVRADAAVLGARAVREAVRLARGESDGEDISLGSSPVYRFSCGCTANPEDSEAGIARLLSEGETGKAADLFLEGFIPRFKEMHRRFPQIQNLREFTVKLFEIAEGKELPGAEKRFAKAFLSGIMDDELKKLLSPEKTVQIIKTLRSAAKFAGTPETEGMVDKIASDCLETVCERLISDHYSTVEDITFSHFLISNITKDMTVYGSDEEKCFFSIVNNLYRIHMYSSYIYTYEEPIIHTTKTEWKQPETVMLRAYHNGGELAALKGDSRKMRSSEILNNSHTPTDRQRNMIIAPLFLNEEQYGVIVCELDNEYFSYIYSITPQICTAIKLSNLVAKLESSLDAEQSRNVMLNRISMTDELTGIYNRRGFYVTANNILKAPENEGKLAVLIFADLDNLKIINDNFGHDDGDYAITSGAEFIKKGLRSSDVVARIGGDEFSAFALCGDREIGKKMPERIKNIAAEHNKKSDKPYNVTLSVGLCEIICSPELNIQQFMDRADEALYADKKTKNRQVFKADTQEDGSAGASR